MRSIRKLVYYCDFGCSTHKLTARGMEVHELHCTLNPNRKCRMPGCVPSLDKACPWCQFAKARQNNWENWDDARDIRAEVKQWRSNYYDHYDRYAYL